MRINEQMKDYDCWLGYNQIQGKDMLDRSRKYLSKIAVIGDSPLICALKEELKKGVSGILGTSMELSDNIEDGTSLVIAKIGVCKSIIPETELNVSKINEEGYMIKSLNNNGVGIIMITAKSDKGLLYGTFSFLRRLQMKSDLEGINIIDNPVNNLRIINHWDNLDGSIERGYAGKSIFFLDNELTEELNRVKDYARLLASIGINSITLNNVNVHSEETKLIGEKLGMVERLAAIFRNYGIKVFLSINYASPIELGGLSTADPLDEGVSDWWKAKVKEIYQRIPDFGGFLVKADSEFRPGPFSYNRSHAQGANMLAEALQPYGGVLIWRCFVYNCQQAWRDYETDRAKAA